MRLLDLVVWGVVVGLLRRDFGARVGKGALLE